MAELYTQLLLPCTGCKLTFNTIHSYNRHIYGGYYSCRTSSICCDKYEQSEQLRELEEIAIERIDKKYPRIYIDIDQLCTFGTERVIGRPVLIDDNDTHLTGTVMLYNDSLRDHPIISIESNDLALSTYIFEQISQQQNIIYRICKNNDMVDLDRIKKIQIPNMPKAQQQEYVNSCSKLHTAFNLIMHGL